jgi:hypothetical protein
MKTLSFLASFRRFLAVISILIMTFGLLGFSSDQPHDAARTQSGRLTIMINGSLTSGFGMGVNTSEGNTGWVKKVADAQVMAYPGGAWGAVFVTVGNPVKMGSRKFKDFSAYTALTIELKGKPGQSVQIGLKSNTDNDDGSETKVPVQISNAGWNFYTIKLKKFESADKKHLYVTPEFVFDDQPQTVSVRNIQFIQ